MSQGDLSKRVHYLKQEERGYEEMCEVAEQIYNQGKEQGIASIISMGRRHHFSDDKIIRELELSMGVMPQEAQKYLDNYEK